MNFFEHQDQARQKTGLLVGLFLLAVAAIIVLTTLLITLSFAGFEMWAGSGNQFQPSQPQWGTFFKTAFAVIAVVASVVVFKRLQISQGGRSVAELLGGKPIELSTNDPYEKRLLNVIEEMAIAAGLPVPPVYVMDETTVNAFAAGFSDSDAVIGVTRGTLERLSREQLQGVVAHEFSHILHGDMRLNLHLITMLAGIIFISQAGRFALHATPRARSRNQGAIPIAAVGLGLIVVGSIGTLFGNIIKSAVSRQREYLADASAVQYTRNPEGIAGALKVIGGPGTGSNLGTPRAEECSHLFFGDAVFFRAFSIFSTHPPIDKRILRIEPNWNGEYLTGKPLREREQPETTQTYQNKIDKLADTIQNTGILDPVMVAIAHSLMQSLPNPLYQATQEPGTAYALMLALRLDADSDVQNKQYDFLNDQPTMAKDVKRLFQYTKNLTGDKILPLVEMSIPALKRQSLPQYKQLKQHLTQFIMADKKSDHKEWVHFRLLCHYLDQFFIPENKRRYKRSYHSFTPIKDDVVLIISLLANEGQDTEQHSDAAFSKGMQILNLNEELRANENTIELHAINNSLEKLEYLVPLLKKQFLTACADCLQTHNEVKTQGWDFLRVIAACLGCPMPIINRPSDQASVMKDNKYA